MRMITFGTLQLAAILAGSGIAVSTVEKSDLSVVHAAQHCTRYAPTVSVDVDCYTKGWMDGLYETPSYAWRDDNRIDLNADRWWEIWFVDGNGANYRYNAGFGIGGFSGGVTSVQTKAICTSNYDLVLGECDTTWQD